MGGNWAKVKRKCDEILRPERYYRLSVPLRLPANPHLRQFFRPKALPGWALFVWAIAGHMSTLQFVVDSVVRVQHWLGPVLPWLSSPWGRFYAFTFGLVWLSAIAWGPKAATHPWSDSEMSPFDLEILQLLAQDFRSYHAQEVASAFRLTIQRAQYQLEKLERSGDAHCSLRDLTRITNNAYAITAKGRQTLVRLRLM